MTVPPPLAPPPYVTIFYAILENQLIEAFGIEMLSYCHFIDNIFAIWLAQAGENLDTECWHAFKLAMNNPEFGLT